MLVSTVISGAVGALLGIRSNATLEGLRAEQAAEAEPSGDMLGLSSEVNRTLLELWKMEDVEFLRNSR